MRPYRINSFYKYKWLRRARYGRGHGVHSPLAYNVIRSIVRPLAGYYVEDGFWMSENEGLLFRMISRSQPTTLHLISDNVVNRELLFMANSKTNIIENIDTCNSDSLLYTNQADIALQFNNQCNGTIILTDIRCSRDSEKRFLKFIENISTGIIIDLFDTAIFVYISDVMYLYRSTT